MVGNENKYLAKNKTKSKHLQLLLVVVLSRGDVLLCAVVGGEAKTEQLQFLSVKLTSDRVHRVGMPRQKDHGRRQAIKPREEEP